MQCTIRQALLVNAMPFTLTVPFNGKRASWRPLPRSWPTWRCPANAGSTFVQALFAADSLDPSEAAKPGSEQPACLGEGRGREKQGEGAAQAGPGSPLSDPAATSALDRQSGCCRRQAAPTKGSQWSKGLRPPRRQGGRALHRRLLTLPLHSPPRLLECLQQGGHCGAAGCGGRGD